MREICTSGSAGGPGGVIPWGYPTVTSLAVRFDAMPRWSQHVLPCDRTESRATLNVHPFKEVTWRTKTSSTRKDST